jgi:hypothetical protein
VGRRGKGWGEGGEMTQTLYAYMNKRKKRSCKRAIVLVKKVKIPGK